MEEPSFFITRLSAVTFTEVAGLGALWKHLRALRMQALKFSLRAKTGMHPIRNHKTKWNPEPKYATQHRHFLHLWRDVYSLPELFESLCDLSESSEWTARTAHSSRSPEWSSAQMMSSCYTSVLCIVWLKPILLLDREYSDERQLQLVAFQFQKDQFPWWWDSWPMI